MVIFARTQGWRGARKIRKMQNKINRYITFIDNDLRNIFPKFQMTPMYGFQMNGTEKSFLVIQG